VVPPFQVGSVLRSRLLAALAEWEGGSTDRFSRAQTRRLAHRAVRAAGRVASRRPEVFRLEGRRRWLAGDRRGAERWWRRAAASAAALGMEPERRRCEAELARAGAG
jgi:hypothetical protein